MKKGTTRIRGIRTPIPTGHIAGRSDSGGGDVHPIKVGSNLSLKNRVLNTDLKLTDGHVFVGDAQGRAADVAMTGDATIDDTGALTVTGLQGVPVAVTAPTNLYVLTFDSGTGMWKPAAASGGGGTPGGSSGQIQYNNSGAFGGFTASGDATINTGTGAVTLAVSGVTAATYGDATHVAQPTFDAKGRATSCASVAITFPVASIFGRTGVVVAATNDYSFSQISGNFTLAQFPSIADVTVLGNVSGGSAVPVALTKTQLTTLINAFSSSLSGAAPASGGGTTNFLRADGAWAAPAGSGTVTTTGSPSSGNLTKFTGASSISNGDLSGDISTSGTLVTTIGAGKVTEAMQVLANNTTNNVSTSKHGYAPILPNDATKYLDGTGAYSVPAGGGASASEIALPPFLDAHTGTAFSNGFFGGRAIIVPFACTINSIKIGAVAASATSKVIPAIYADNAGSYGSLLGQGAQVTGVTQGLNKFPLSSGLAVTKGQIIWIGIQLTVANFTAFGVTSTVGFFTSTGSLPNPPSSVTYSSQTWGSVWASTDT